VIALLTLIVLLAVVRPMMKTALGQRKTRKRGSEAPENRAEESDEMLFSAIPRDSAAAQMIEMAKVSGQIRSESVERIGDMVKGNPQETVAVLRNWIHDR
jgi:flagellar M-ring protein FliF